MLVELAQTKTGAQEVSYPNFKQLFDKRKEIEFFREATKFGAENRSYQFRFSSLLHPYEIQLLFIPARFLPVVCAETTEGKIKATKLGNLLRNFQILLTEKQIESYFILTAGAAKEIIPGAKPFSKTRINKNGTLLENDYQFDGDFILVVDKTITEKEVTDILSSFGQEYGIIAQTISSHSRPFVRIEISEPSIKNPREIGYRGSCLSLGHISFPKNHAKHSAMASFFKHMLSCDSNCQGVLIVPVNTPEGFVGVGVNLFTNYNDRSIYFNQRNHENKIIRRTLRIATIEEFTEAFPFELSPAEAYARFLHLLRDCTWDNKLRMIQPINLLSSLDSVKDASLLTANRFAKEIVYPISSDPSLIITDPRCMREFANRTFDALKSLLNGDPYLGYQYLLPAGLSLTDAPVFGMGIIDGKGLFPKLFRFLSEKGRFQELLKIMETCDWGAAQLGWPTFVAYIYEQTGRNLREVDELLCPAFCSNEIFPTLVDNYMRKALSRFYPIPLRDPRTGAFPANQ